MVDGAGRSPATLRDVAASAGVSPTTVSYVLNGRGDQMRISPTTVARVRAAASELAYRPNPKARSLRTRSTATIGFISDQIASNPYGVSILSGASQAAQERGHLVLLAEGGDPVFEHGLIEDLLDRGVDGVVYATRTTRTVRLPEPLHGVPVVLVNCEDPHVPRPSIVPDDHGGGRAAAGILLAVGVSDVAVVGAPGHTTSSTSASAASGAAEGAAGHGLAGALRIAGIRVELATSFLEVGAVLPCEWTTAAAFDATTCWLANGGRAEGLICMDDRIAMGAYQALAEAGLRVPDDISVVSFDGSALASWLRPALTSLNVPAAELGALAVRRLLARSEPEHAASLRKTVPMSVRVGRSVRHPP